jgi:hypothetical protein
MIIYGWIRAYPIHVEDIHKLKGLSMEGKDVTQIFQGLGSMTTRRESLSL